MTDKPPKTNRAAKKKRTELQSAFTSCSGPGAQVASSFKEVMAKLHFETPHQQQKAKEIAALLSTKEDDEEKSPPKSKSKLVEAWSQGRYYLLPSFIHFLFFVAEKEDVKLVFRTFGEDVVDVAKEIELLVEGKHPFCEDGVSLLDVVLWLFSIRTQISKALMCFPVLVCAF